MLPQQTAWSIQVFFYDSDIGYGLHEDIMVNTALVFCKITLYKGLYSFLASSLPLFRRRDHMRGAAVDSIRGDLIRDE